MKKVTALLIAGTMVLSLASCSSDPATPETSEPTTVASTETTEATESVEETTAEPTIEETEPAETTRKLTEPIYLPVIEGPDSIEQYEGYNLVWFDEFDGEELNLDNWNVTVAREGANNSELQAYVDNGETVYVQDGHLVLNAIKHEDEDGKVSYTSGKVTTFNKMDLLYGKIVVSAKVPEGRGLWPAIWMMPTNERRFGTWPKCGEIDIMEIICQDTKTTYSTIHYGNPHASQQGIMKLDSGSFADGFHEYALEWEPGEMRFYTDGVLVLTVNDWFTGTSENNTMQYPAPFNQEFYLQLNLAVGGTWPGDPDENTDFTKSQFEIDYVHVYQKDYYDTDVYKPEVTLRGPAYTDGNYVFDYDFSSEEEDFNGNGKWTYYNVEDGVGSAEIVDQVAVISTEDQGSVDYAIQFVQPNIPLKQGSTYKYSFEAWSDEERDMVACITGPNADYIRYLEDQTVTLGTSKKTYEFEFTMNGFDDPAARIEFNMGATSSTANIYIDNVVLVEVE
ncbi:MAG: family 16 glycosylhydrolase [Clostridia bacterium]|nr:family 16 glycosylhydrolase [Clostridia bacterium]